MALVVHSGVLLLLQLSTFLAMSWGQSFPSSSAIEQRLNTFATAALAVDSMQQLYDNNVEAATTTLDGMQIASSLASTISTRVSRRMSVVSALRSEARNAYSRGQTSSTLTQCCLVSRNSVQFDARFNTTVNTNSGCDRVSGNAASSRRSISQTFTNEAKKQLGDTPETKFQYYGSEEGYSTIYPGFNITDCRSYDPRYRPWYVAAAVPTPKDLVIVVDVSGSMGNLVTTGVSRLDLAKLAIESILDTLSDEDLVTVVPFNDKVLNVASLGSREECFNSQLGQVTPYSRTALRKLVNALKAAGGTTYGPPISAAYDHFSNRATTFTRERMIVFLTDGSPFDSLTTILNDQETAARPYNYAVTVLTYAMGTGIQSTGLEILRRMAAQQYISTSLPAGAKIGRFQQISDFNNLRASLSVYYSFFATEFTTATTKLTLPYYDAFGLGTILTAASPVYTGTPLTLTGVVGVDITISDLFGDISYFSDDEHQYAFLMHNSGACVLHPLLSQPADISADPVFQDTTLLETDKDFETQIYWQMRNRTTGSATFMATRYIPLGNSRYVGTQSVRVLSSYYWAPVAGTDFSLCIVLNDETSNAVGQLRSQAIPSTNTLYHKLGLVATTGQRCNQNGHLAISDQSAVKFSPEAFTNPSYYLNVPETTADITSYFSYLDGRGANNHFKTTVRDSVRLTAALDSLWQRPQADAFKRSVVWRYIGAIDGVFRILPGTELPTAYDHLVRVWFTQALNRPGDIILSSPYPDAFGAGFVVTLSRSIRQSNDSAMTSAVGAVMGMDFTLGFLGLTLEQAYPDCAQQNLRCVLFDSAGYLVYHPDFVDFSSESPEWVHLGNKEPYLMRELHTKGLARKVTCSKYDTFERFVTYRMDFGSSNSVTGTYSCSVSVNYNVQRLSGTNVYIAFLTSNQCSFNNLGVCYCPIRNGLASTCTRSSTCECPCRQSLSYDPCSNSFPASSRSYDVCPAEVAGLPVVPRRPQATVGLEQCFNGTCSPLQEASDCRATQGCAWCTVGSNLVTLATPSCTSDCLCFGGRMGQKNPSGNCDQSSGGGGDSDGSSSSSSAGGIVGGVIGGSVGGIFFIVCLIKYCNRPKASSVGPTSAYPSSSGAGAAAAVGTTYTPAATSEKPAPSAPAAAPQPSFNPNAPPDYSSAVNMGSDFTGAGYSANPAYPPAAPYPNTTSAPYPNTTPAPYPSSNPPYPI